MGIDLPRRKKTRRAGSRAVVSKNPQLMLLVTLYEFLSRRAESKFNTKIAQRLRTSSWRRKAPVSLRRLIHEMEGKESKTAVIVGSVTNDLRVYDVPKLSVCALKFSEVVRRRIEASGGECLTFDQLSLRYPKGENCVLLTAPGLTPKKRIAPGLPGANTRELKPYSRN